ncbi:Microrchidia-like protein [Thalictrum thalictroides]|uniref:Microrchidia-like protein n=1 Tax=Thalictrum thalictroides TaxID=46969 RepID=A0A7J6UTB8_THATH|nr:Microrchidia-like protein [Thalictrum thalictroides]
MRQEEHQLPSVNGNLKSSSTSESGNKKKKRKIDTSGVVLPSGFLDPLPPMEVIPISKVPMVTSFDHKSSSSSSIVVKSCKQFWKAGDYEISCTGDLSSSSFGGLDHVRVHPKFLHSNATSHKWALGAFAELLDNSVDEISHGATYVNVDMQINKKDGSKMLLVQDNGAGMSPDTMRHCMSFGYSTKSKMANTIGQYGNGFKTSTMRLGADVIVFSRCLGKDGKRPTQSIGMLSYTFLTSTGKDDIVVPILDYEKGGQIWNGIMRPSIGNWTRNLETILQWSPYSSEQELLQQLNLIEGQGTRVLIYNLWEDDEGELELDFDTDKHDIRIRGTDTDKTKIEMTNIYPSSKHFLTLPRDFRIILRGEDVEHHNIVNDMMLITNRTYRPVSANGLPSNMSADITMGFVKDAKSHIDIQGFNVYHKNRLIKPFWRVWHAAGSDGRGVIGISFKVAKSLNTLARNNVLFFHNNGYLEKLIFILLYRIIGVLEANFVEPAHDKQGFENTIVLQRLMKKLKKLQHEYWNGQCQEIGYAPRRKKLQNTNKQPELEDNDSSSESSFGKTMKLDSLHGKRPVSLSSTAVTNNDKHMPKGQSDLLNKNVDQYPTSLQGKRINTMCILNEQDPGVDIHLNFKNPQLKPSLFKAVEECFTQSLRNGNEKSEMMGNQQPNLHSSTSDLNSILLLENNDLKEKLKKREESFSLNMQFEKDRYKTLEATLKEKEKKIEELDKETETLIDIFSEERNRRDNEEQKLRTKLKEASTVIQELVNKLKMLENMNSSCCKQEK